MDLGGLHAGGLGLLSSQVPFDIIVSISRSMEFVISGRLSMDGLDNPETFVGLPEADALGGAAAPTGSKNETRASLSFPTHCIIAEAFSLDKASFSESSNVRQWSDCA